MAENSILDCPLETFEMVIDAAEKMRQIVKQIITHKLPNTGFWLNNLILRI